VIALLDSALDIDGSRRVDEGAAASVARPR
jgi:hypothetical protein